MDITELARDIPRGIDISQGRIFPSRDKDRKIHLRPSHHPTVSRIDLIEFLELAVLQNLVEKFVRKEPFLFFCRSDPFFDYCFLDPANRVLLRNASVRYPIEMAV